MLFFQNTELTTADGSSPDRHEMTPNPRGGMLLCSESARNRTDRRKYHSTETQRGTRYLEYLQTAPTRTVNVSTS